MQDLDAAFSKHRKHNGQRFFEWKLDSLKFLVGFSVNHGPHNLCVEVDGRMVRYTEKDSTFILGNLFDTIGSSSTSFHVNAGRAETHYYKHQHAYRHLAISPCKRLKSWHAAGGAIASYNSSTWHLTAGLVSEIRTLELQLLRTLLRMRRRPGEEAFTHNQRTSVLIGKWQSTAGTVPTYGRVIKSVSKAAWKDYNFSLDNGSSPLGDILGYRGMQWWETLQSLAPPYKRQKLVTHARSGRQRALWEHPFCTVWGCTWRDRVRDCGSLSQWMGLYKEFATLCVKRGTCLHYSVM